MGVLGGSKRIVENYYCAAAVAKGQALKLAAGVQQIGDTINEGNPIPIPTVAIAGDGEKPIGIALHDTPAGAYGEMVTRGAVLARCADTTNPLAAGEAATTAASGVLDDDASAACAFAMEAGQWGTGSTLTWVYFDPSGVGGS